MLTVRSRDDGRREEGLGFRFGGMDENELEEGEACSDQDDDAFTDLEALTYIDEKLQNVLGHFQKDFEGQVSVETLGSTYGHYGSFLPMYQRSPRAGTQARSLPIPPSHNGVRSPGNHVSVAAAHPKPSIPIHNASMARNAAPTASAAPSLGRQHEGVMDLNAENVGDYISPHGSAGTFPGNDHKAFKFRIKVRSESVSAIYSGLGLDVSPSPVAEGSPSGSEGFSTEIRDAAHESPLDIIQIMTSFPVPGECLLSPLSDYLFHLPEKETRLLNSLKINMVDTCKAGPLSSLPYLSQSANDMESMVRNKINHSKKSKKVMNSNNLACKNDATASMKTPAEHDYSNALNIPSISSLINLDEKDEGMLLNESAKWTKVPDISFEQGKVSTKDRVQPADLKTKNKTKMKVITKNSGSGSSGNEEMHSNGELNFRESVPVKVKEEKGTLDRSGLPDVPKGSPIEVDRTKMKVITKNSGSGSSGNDEMHSNGGLDVKESVLVKIKEEKGMLDRNALPDVPKGSPMEVDRTNAAKMKVISKRKSSGSGSSGNEEMHSNGGLIFRESVPIKVKEEKGLLDRNGLPDVTKGSPIEVDRTDVANKGDFEEHKSTKVNKMKNSEFVKKKSSLGISLCEEGGEIMLQGTNQATRDEEKAGTRTSGPLPSDSSRKKNKSQLPFSLKENTEAYSVTADYSHSMYKDLNSYDAQNTSYCKDSNGNLVDTKVEVVDRKHTMTRDTDKSKYLAEGNGREMVKPTERLKDSSVYKKVGNAPAMGEKVVTPPMAALTPSMLPSDAVGALHASVVIKENWVCCDSCEQWRLLPYDANPDYYGTKQFLCSMQTWLASGLRNCSTSEDETTKALHALYHIPAPVTDSNPNGLHYDTASSMKLTDNAYVNQSTGDTMFGANGLGKKRHGSKDRSSTSGNPPLIPCPNSKKKSAQDSKSRYLNDMNRQSGEPNSSDKLGMEHAKKQSDFSLDNVKYKQKDKHEVPGVEFDTVDIFENGAKHSKSKSTKRARDQDGGLRASKKTKTGGLGGISDERSDEGSGREISYADNSLLHKSNNKNPRNHNHSSKDLKHDLRNDASAGRIKGQVQVQSDTEDRGLLSPSNIEKSDNVDFATKKRKVREWQEHQTHKEVIVGSQQFVENTIVVKEAFSENELKKEKKAKSSKFDAKESISSKTDDRTRKLTKIVISSVKQHVPNVMEESRMISTKETQLEQYRESNTNRQVSDGMESCRKDFLYSHPSAAAVSSSSKVSGSRRSRMQDVNGSPVESVSSSPIRTSNMDNVRSSRMNLGSKDDVVVAGFSVTATSKKCPDGQGVGAFERPGKTNKIESDPQRSSEELNGAQPLIMNSSGGTHEYADKKAKNFYDKAKYGMHLKLFGEVQEDLSPADVEHANNVSDGTGGSHDEEIFRQNQEDVGIDRMANGVSRRKSSKSSSHLNEKHSPRSNKIREKHQLNYSEHQELNSSNLKRSLENCVDNNSLDRHTLRKNSTSGNFTQEKKDEDFSHRKGTSLHVSIRDPKDVHLHPKEAHESCVVEKPPKGSKLKDATSVFRGKSSNQDGIPRTSHEVDKNKLAQSEMATGRARPNTTMSSRDKAEMAQDLQTVHIPCKSEAFTAGSSNGDVSKIMKTENLNGVNHHNSRQTANGHVNVRGLDKKDGHHLSIALKEAKVLKHTATRLMKDGQILESLGLYYESCLKFLLIAFQMENADSSRNGESSQSVKIYSDTAKFCDYCAREYEKNKQMAAAALSYKCTELAYMKVLYLKHSSAGKDRHELQTALRVLLPGESPSSSASDVDNLINQGTSDKVVPTKGVASPQITGNNIMSTNNRQILERLLDYNNDTFCAFEATRKMHIAFNAARECLNKDSSDLLSTVKMALDSSFHDVERLVQLLRLSMESVNR